MFRVTLSNLVILILLHSINDKIFKNINFYFILFFVLNTTTKSIESKIIAKVENSILTSHELKNKIRVTLILSDQEINQNNINNVKSNVLTSLLNLKIKN